MTAIKTYPEYILSTNQNSVITSVGHNSLNQDVAYETISVIKSNQHQNPQMPNIFAATAGNNGTLPQVIARRSSAANLINGGNVQVSNAVGGITVKSSNFLNGVEASASQQLVNDNGPVFSLNSEQGVMVGGQQGLMVANVGQLTANPKGELVLADLELNNQQVSYQIMEVPVTSCSTASKVEILSGDTVTPLGGETDSQDGNDLDLEVVTSTVDSVLLRNVNNGALYRSDVLNTTVSANGHVLKTVSGKGIGVVTIVDDKANVEVERAYLESKKLKKSDQQSTNIVSLSSAFSPDNQPILTTLNNQPILTTLNAADFSPSSVLVSCVSPALHTTNIVPQSSVLQYTNATDSKGTAVTTVSYSDLDGLPLNFSTVEAVPLNFAPGACTPLDFSVTAVSEAVVPVAAQFTLQEDGNVVLTPSIPNNEHKEVEDEPSPPESNLKIKGAKKNKRRRLSDEETSLSPGGDRECQVCKGTAGRHSYYGGQVCTSCRAFFRRSVISKARFTYFCIKQGECEVTCKTRKQCQYCRYKQCEVAGMKSSWVLTDGKAGSNETSDINKDEDEPPEKRSKDGDTDSDSEARKLVYITEHELSFIQSLVDSWEYSNTNKVNDLGTDLVKEILRMITFGKNLTKTGFEHLIETLKRRMYKAASKIGDMNSIGSEDRSEILEHNVPLLVKLSLAILINPNLTWDKQLEGLLGTEQIVKLKEKFAGRPNSEKMCGRLEYEQFFSCLKSEQELKQEQEFIKVMQEIGDWPTDKEEFILISMMILFCGHSLNLQDRARIDEIQAYIGEILHNYLNHRFGKEKGRSKFATGVYLINRCQYLHSLSHHKLLI